MRFSFLVTARWAGSNCPICCNTVTTLHGIKISILLFIQLTRCLQGSMIDHLSLCSSVTIGHLPHHQHFYFHYNFIIRTPWVRGSLKKAVTSLPWGPDVRPQSAEPSSDIFPLSLSSTGWHCWSLAKDNMIKPCAWATVEGNISPLGPLRVESRWITRPRCPVTWKTAPDECARGLRETFILSHFVSSNEFFKVLQTVCETRPNTHRREN